jgi:hypothetical protein
MSDHIMLKQYLALADALIESADIELPSSCTACR